jgi:hypothetical protein
MSDISQGNFAKIVLNPGDVYRVITGGVATVAPAYGAPAGTTTVTASSQTFGPYGVNAKLIVTATTGACQVTKIESQAITQIDGAIPPGPSADALAGFIRPALVSAAWANVPSLSRLRVVGTGPLSIDSRDRAGNVTTAVFAGSYSATAETIEFPYYGDSAVQIRATFPSNLTVEVI